MSVLIKVLCILAFGVLAYLAPQGETESHWIPGTSEEIGQLIRQLGDPNPEVRESVARRLSAAGEAARAPLEVAAKGDDFETAVRARELLVVLNRLLFGGVHVSLSFSKSHIGWDQPVDLILRFSNPTEFPATLAFATSDATATGSSETGTDAEQVGAVLDVADWLTVRGPGGEPIDLRVDPIGDDPSVVAAVHHRINGGSTSILKPGQTATLVLKAINRGWARFPTLDEGTYSVIFAYEPQWDDEVLHARRVGRVESSPATIQVTKGAPPEVLRSGQISTLALRERNGQMVVILTNHRDQTQFVNRNFGFAPPFAKGHWVCRRGESTHELVHGSAAHAGLADFDSALLTAVEAGGHVELASISVAELRNKLAGAGAALSSGGWTVQFRYNNSCERAWQMKQGAALLGNPNAPAIFRTPLPRLILATNQASDEIPLPAGS